MFKKIFIPIFAATILFSCSQEEPQKQLTSLETFELINTEVKSFSEAYMNLQNATSTIGHRLTGTENGAKAEQLAFDLFTKYGLQNVRFFDFEARSWLRGDVKLEVDGNDLACVSLAHSPVMIDTTAQIIDLGNGLQRHFDSLKNQIAGKIVLMNIGNENGREGEENLHRSEKSLLAIDNGAAGIIFKNQVTGEILLTGTASVTGDLIPIPAVCVSFETGEKLRESLKTKPNAMAHIQMSNKSEIIKARNVIAEHIGTELPNEYIVVGGHLDSWDLATGAIDNGIGSFSIIDIARTFAKLKLNTKRSIRFVMFMGEEEGLLGSRAYVKHLKETNKLAEVKYMVNLDMTGNAKGFNAFGREEMVNWMDSIGKLIAQADTFFANENTNTAGLHSDHQPFMMEGIPVTWPNSNMNKGVYGCYHSSCDHFDLVKESDMVNNVRFTGMFLYELANAPTLPQHLPSEEVKAFLEKHNLKEKLILGKDWRW